MNPEERGVFRLGGVVLGSMYSVALLAMLVSCLPWYGVIVAGVLLGLGLVKLDTRLYRWVTAPERESNEDPLS